MTAAKLGGRAVLVVVAAAVVAQFGWPAAVEGECPAHPASCHFADSYVAARALFRDRAQTLQRVSPARLDAVEHFALPVDNPDPADPVQNLTIDVVLVRGPGAQPDGPLLLHLSGVHGCEGHAGGAVQSSLLDAWAHDPSLVPDGVTAVLVHAVNPFGFHRGRRTNEQNVDLNRNLLLDHSSAAFAVRDHETRSLYQPMYELLNPTSASSVLDDLQMFGRLAHQVATRGYVHVKRAFVTGQYHDPRAAQFGGDRLQASHAAVLAWLEKHCARHDRIFMVDVHTGLGPSGVDTLMLEGATPRAYFKTVFGQPADPAAPDFLYSALDDPDSTDGAGAGYDLATGFTANYLTKMQQHGPGWGRHAGVTQEFGTRSSLEVARGLVRENALWHTVNRSDTVLMARRAREARDLFYVRTARWHAQIVARGLAVAKQALAALADSTGPRLVPTAPTVT